MQLDEDSHEAVAVADCDHILARLLLMGRLMCRRWGVNNCNKFGVSSIAAKREPSSPFTPNVWRPPRPKLPTTAPRAHSPWPANKSLGFEFGNLGLGHSVWELGLGL